MNNPNSISNVFILSLNRSGSTLLTSILNAHPKVIGLPESSFSLNLAIHFQKANYTNDDYERIVSALWIRMRAFEKVWNLDKKVLLNNLQKTKPQTIKAIIQEIQLSYSQRKDILCVVDKNPIYNHFIDLLNRTFEGNKKIILLRDYRDRFHSLTTQNQKISYLKRLFHHFSWKVQVKKYLEIIRKNPTNVLLIKFEDLIIDPVATSQRICEFLELDFEENMIHNRLSAIPDFSSTKELTIKHQRTRNEFDLSQINKVDHLSIKDLKALHFFNSKIGSQLGYYSEIKLSIFEKTIIFLKHLPVLLIYKIFFLATRMSYYIPLSIQKKTS